jgi:hypothetical protein
MLSPISKQRDSNKKNEKKFNVVWNNVESQNPIDKGKTKKMRKCFM